MALSEEEVRQADRGARGGAPVLTHKDYDTAEYKVESTSEGIIEAIVSVFNNVDSAKEIVMPGFFAESIATRRNAKDLPKAKGTWSHDWTVVVAKTLDAKELLPGDPLLPPSLADLGGLWVRGQFNLDTQPGFETFSNISKGYVDEFSIGYRVLRDEYDQETGVRKLLRGEWYEWSPVLVGANPKTELLSTKAGLALTDHAERVLAGVEGLTERLLELAALRAKDGRHLSEANLQKIAGITAALTAAQVTAADLLTAAGPPPTDDDTATKAAPDLMAEVAAFLAFEARLNGVPI